MKAFVYNKDTKSELFKTIKDVKEVRVHNGWIIIVPEDGMTLTFNTKKYKTTIYQN